MAGRPHKDGLDYFELDCHLDTKTRLIQVEFGLSGFAIIVLLYQKIYGEQGYYTEWNEDELLLFMSDNGIACERKNFINEVVSACIRRDIFSKDIFEKYGVLTSHGIQKRYLRAVAKRENKNLKKEYLLLGDGKNSISSVNNSISSVNNSINDGRNAQRREEKIRVEKSREEDILHGAENSAHVPPAEAFADVEALILNTGEEWRPTVSLYDELARLYMGVDLAYQFRKMRAWCLNNAQKRKTKKGIQRFVNSWLAKEQDRIERSGWQGRTGNSYLDSIHNRISVVEEWARNNAQEGE